MLHARHRLVAMACVAAWLLTACGPGVTPVTPGPTTTPYPSGPPTARPSATPSPTATPFPSPTALAYLDDMTAILAATSGVDGARIAYDDRLRGIDGRSGRDPDDRHGRVHNRRGPSVPGGDGHVRRRIGHAWRSSRTASSCTCGAMPSRALDPKGRWIRVDTTSKHPNAAAFSGALIPADRPVGRARTTSWARRPRPRTSPPRPSDGEPVRRIRLQLDLDTAVAASRRRRAGLPAHRRPRPCAGRASHRHSRPTCGSTTPTGSAASATGSTSAAPSAAARWSCPTTCRTSASTSRWRSRTAKDTVDIETLDLTP